MMTRVFGEWQHLVGKPVSVEELDEGQEWASIPAFHFYFMLTMSAAIATFGLLSNSAATIIGAMIVAPLMNPIISTAYSGVTRKRQLMFRSLFTLVTGTIWTIGLAFLFTVLIGWKAAGSEILARMSPSMLDLGVALAAGAAGAYSYTRPKISSGLAGVAIAVALVPPLCVVGIGLALGDDLARETGLASADYGADGAFLLYLTNLFGIIFAACMVFLIQYFGSEPKAAIAPVVALLGLLSVAPPLQFSLDNLMIRNAVSRNLGVVARYVLEQQDSRLEMTKLSAHITRDGVLVSADVTAPVDTITQEVVDTLRNQLSETLNRRVDLEMRVSPTKLIASSKDQVF